MPIILGAVLLVAGYFGFNKIRFMLNNEDTDNAYLEADITNISPKVQGYVASVRVKENQHVKTGDTLFVLDSRELLLKVKQAEAALQNAIANVGAIQANSGTAGANIATADANTQTSEAGVESATAAIRTAEANVDAAKARAWQATQDFKRYETLVGQGAVTQQQFDA
ncbi:MAG: biotin/lipoyl-binding protein, partial [Bacteroidota bacterium]